MHRRQFLRVSLGTAGLVLARAAFADMAVEAERMGPMVQVLAGVSVGSAAVQGAQVDLRTDGTRDFVKLSQDLGAFSPHIFSADNANARYTVWVMTQPLPDGSWPYLVFGGETRMASSHGQDDRGHTATFEVDDAFAKKLASAWGITRSIRLPLDGGLRYAWTNPGGAQAGKPVRIRLRVDNKGPLTVRFAIGGRQRGVRDNRFSFRVRKDGREVAVKDEPDFGGLMQYHRLAPGDHVEVEADLRTWIDAPGAYDLECEYQGEVVGDSDDAPRWPDHAAETWDVAPRATMRVVIP